MQLGSQWFVEFAAREHQAREERRNDEPEREAGTPGLIAAPSFGQRCLGSAGQLLLIAGAWLSRQAGEVYRMDAGIEALRDRSVEQGAAPRL